jgi:hypothetical protein
MCAEFLDKHYDKFFEKYKKLLNSDNYVTRRQSLKVGVYANNITPNMHLFPSTSTVAGFPVVRSLREPQ